MTTEDVDAAAGRGPGRPRNVEADAAILRATIEVLAAHGAAGCTMDAVAEAAGVAKTTIYRRWSSKAELLVDAVRATAASVRPPDTGSVRADLLAMMSELVRLFTTTPAGDAARALIGELPQNRELEAAFRGSVLAERFALAEAVLRGGIERGELSPDADTHLVAEMVIAPLFFRQIVSGERLSVAFAERVIDHALARVRMPGR